MRLTPLALLVTVRSACAGEETPSPADPRLDRELVEAGSAGDLEAVRSLLERGAGVDARDANGATALIAASYGNDVEVAAELVEAGADVDVHDRTEQSAYLIATSEVGDDPALLELALLRRRRDPPPRRGARVRARASGYSVVSMLPQDV